MLLTNSDIINNRRPVGSLAHDNLFESTTFLLITFSTQKLKFQKYFSSRQPVDKNFPVKIVTFSVARSQNLTNPSLVNCLTEYCNESKRPYPGYFVRTFQLRIFFHRCAIQPKQYLDKDLLTLKGRSLPPKKRFQKFGKLRIQRTNLTIKDAISFSCSSLISSISNSLSFILSNIDTRIGEKG